MANTKAMDMDNPLFLRLLNYFLTTNHSHLHTTQIVEVSKLAKSLIKDLCRVLVTQATEVPCLNTPIQDIQNGLAKKIYGYKVLLIMVLQMITLISKKLTPLKNKLN